MKEEVKIKPRKKHYPKPRKEKECPYCGSTDFERISLGHVGVVSVCKDCKEEL